MKGINKIVDIMRTYSTCIVEVQFDIDNCRGSFVYIKPNSDGNQI